MVNTSTPKNLHTSTFFVKNDKILKKIKKSPIKENIESIDKLLKFNHDVREELISANTQLIDFQMQRLITQRKKKENLKKKQKKIDKYQQTKDLI